MIRRVRKFRGEGGWVPRVGTTSDKFLGLLLVEGRPYSFLARLSQLTIDHVFLSRWSAVPTLSRERQERHSNIWAFISFFPNTSYIDHIHMFCLSYPLLVLAFYTHRLSPRIAGGGGSLETVRSADLTHLLFALTICKR